MIREYYVRPSRNGTLMFPVCIAALLRRKPASAGTFNHRYRAQGNERDFNSTSRNLMALGCGFGMVQCYNFRQCDVLPFMQL
jgi:hypothetical protein